MFGERCGILATCANFSTFDLDVACCRALILEGDLTPRIGVAGDCADLQLYALALLDVDRAGAGTVVAFQHHALQRNLVKQPDAVSAHNRACRMGGCPLVAGVDIIGFALGQTGHRGGIDLLAAARPLAAGGGGAGGVDILLLGIEVLDLKLFVISISIRLRHNVRPCRGFVIGGLADLQRCADDLAEIALRRDLHADADILAHVSRHRGIAATGRALNILPCAAAVRAALPLVRRGGACGGHAGSGGDAAAEDDAAGVVHLAREGGNGFNHRRLLHHQLDDMIVGENADEAAVLFQIQLQIKGIDLGFCARKNGDRMRGCIGIDVLRFLHAGGAGNIMLALGGVAVACFYQFVRQRIPLEREGMRRAVGNLLNFALEVLGVVDLFAVQRDGLHAPCVGDDRDRTSLGG